MSDDLEGLLTRIKSGPGGGATPSFALPKPAGRSSKPKAKPVTARFPEGGSASFADELRSRIDLVGPEGDARPTVRISDQGRGSMRTDQIFINVYNVPASQARGVALENNRMMIIVDGFSKGADDAPPPSGKVRVELHIAPSSRNRAERITLRAKSGSIPVIAQYIADFVNEFVATHDPVL